MPTETFFNLLPAKREAILNAALKEFSQRSLEEASVANIVRDSQIARGSFYKYFENIEELYAYLYHLITKQAHGSVLDAIKKEQGNLFAGLERYLHELIKAYSDEKYHEYFRVLTMNLSYATEIKLAPKKAKTETPTTSVHDFTTLIDLDDLTISTQDELATFFKLLVPVIHECLNEYFAENWTEEKLMTEYHKRIFFLKHGVLK